MLNEEFEQTMMILNIGFDIGYDNRECFILIDHVDGYLHMCTYEIDNKMQI